MINTDKKRVGAPTTKPIRVSICFRIDEANVNRLDYYKKQIIGNGKGADSISDTVNAAIESYLDVLGVPADVPKKSDFRAGVDL